MLYPQSNPFRQHIDLSGFWDLRFDPAGTGTAAGFPNGFGEGRPAAVPASWNDQFEEDVIILVTPGIRRRSICRGAGILLGSRSGSGLAPSITWRRSG